MKESSAAVLMKAAVKSKKRAMPLGDWILIRRIEEKSGGLIELPDNAKERSDTGIVVAIGPGATALAGDEVMFTKYGMDVKVDGEKMVLVKSSEVYMKYSNDDN
jgi:chaperonin GroES